MQEKLTITLSPQFITALSGNVNPSALQTELEKHEVQIASLLTGYHWSEKGVVNTIRIEPDSIKINDAGKGSFKVRYAINIHYGCSDMDVDLDKSMRIDIITNTSEDTAVLIGEFIPEREPDGY